MTLEMTSCNPNLRVDTVGLPDNFLVVDPTVLHRWAGEPRSDADIRLAQDRLTFVADPEDPDEKLYTPEVHLMSSALHNTAQYAQECDGRANHPFTKSFKAGAAVAHILADCRAVGKDGMLQLNMNEGGTQQMRAVMQQLVSVERQAFGVFHSEKTKQDTAWNRYAIDTLAVLNKAGFIDRTFDAAMHNVCSPKYDDIDFRSARLGGAVMVLSTAITQAERLA